MARSSRKRFSVDLGELRGALLERARAQGVSPSDLVRSSLARSLGSDAPVTGAPPARAALSVSERSRLTLRMTRGAVASVVQAARASGLPAGAYVAGLVAGIPVLASGTGRADHLAALVRSNVEIAGLSRNIHHLCSLLRQGAFRPALEYRDMLDNLSGEVGRHLRLASAALAALQPRGRAATPTKERS